MKNNQATTSLAVAIAVIIFTLAGVSGTFLPLLIFVVFAVAIITSIFKNPDLKNAIQKKGTLSSDGHIVPANQDLTCENDYGHNHGKPVPERYIVHEDDNLGDRWIILNGKKISLKEAAKY